MGERLYGRGELGAPVRRYMHVDAAGRAVSATVVEYRNGYAELFAYVASCSAAGCWLRHPFFSPADRQRYADDHHRRTGHLMRLTVEPWDFTNPPPIPGDGPEEQRAEEHDA